MPYLEISWSSCIFDEKSEYFRSNVFPHRFHGPDSRAATELIKIDGMLDAITGHLRAADDELFTEIAWVVLYLSALSTTAVNLIVKTDIGQLLIGRLAASESLQLRIPMFGMLKEVAERSSSSSLAESDAKEVDNVLPSLTTTSAYTVMKLMMAV